MCLFTAALFNQDVRPPVSVDFSRRGDGVQLPADLCSGSRSARARRWGCRPGQDAAAAALADPESVPTAETDQAAAL